MRSPNLDQCLHLLRATPNAISALCASVTDAQAQTRFVPDAWSMVGTLRHMIDVEREDFRAHLQVVLKGGVWQPINPSAWVTERAYNTTPLNEGIVSFIEERGKSLEYLRSISDGAIDWERMHQTSFGEISAGEVFASWVEHDNLHLRQLVEIRHHITLATAGGFDAGYAGDW